MSRLGPAPCLLAAWLTLSGFGWPRSEASFSAWSEAPSAETRARAVRELSLQPRPPQAGVVRALQLGLEDEAPAVRREAARALGRLEVNGALAALVECLEDPAADVRGACARALGELGQPRAAHALARGLADADPEVRVASLQALAQLDADAPRPEVLGRLADADARVRVEAAHTLARTADAAAAGALARLADDPAPEVRVAALGALSRVAGASSLHVYLRALQDPAEPVVIAALSAIGASGEPDAASTLARYVGDPRDRVARAAYAALAVRPNHEATRLALAHAIEPRLQGLAGAALARIRRSDPALQAAVDEGLSMGIAFADPAAAAHWLALAGEARGERPASPALRSALLAELARSRLPLQDILAVLDDADVETCARLFAQGPGQTHDARRALLRAGAPCVERDGGLWSAPLRDWLARLQPPEISPGLVRLLGATGDPAMAEALVPLLDDPRWQVRAAAFDALAHTGGSAHAPPALDALQADPVAEVRAAAARAYGRLAATEALDALWKLPGERRRHPPFWLAAAAALRAGGDLPGKRDNSFAAALRQAIVEGDEDATATAAVEAAVAWNALDGWNALTRVGTRHSRARRVAAARALGRAPAPGARAHLEALVGDRDPAVAVAALGALAPRLTGNDAPWLLSLAREGAWPAGPAAAFVLARLATRGALDATHVPGLCELALSAEPHTSANGIAALAALHHLECAQPMLEAARERDDVRGRSARHALGVDGAGPTPGQPPAEVPWLAAQYDDGSVALVARDGLDPAREAGDLRWVGSAYRATFLRLPPRATRE